MHGKNIKDEFVVYRSPDDDGMYVAHSIRTDQIGVGTTPVEAIYELFLALRSLLEEAATDPTIDVDCLAPERVKKLFFEANQIPDDIWDAVKLRVASGRAADAYDLSEDRSGSREVSEETWYGHVASEDLRYATA